jgi:hypothetical protein
MSIGYFKRPVTSSKPDQKNVEKAVKEVANSTNKLSRKGASLKFLP